MERGFTLKSPPAQFSWRVPDHDRLPDPAPFDHIERAVADTPDDLVFEHLQGIAFPEQPLGRSILGTAKTVRSFDEAKLRDYLAQHYRAPDVFIAAAGAVDHAAVVAEVERRFRTRYIPAQKLYFAAARPADHADIVVHNDEPLRPAWVVRPH